MNRTRKVTLGAGVIVAAAATALTVGALTTGAGATPTTASSAITLRFSNHLDTIQPVDAAPPGPSAGDSYYVGSHVVSGAQGRTGAACVTVTASGSGIRSCEVDFLLAHGIIATRGITDTANTKVQLVVTGGTGRYAGARGTGSLTPTQGGSDVVLRVR